MVAAYWALKDYMLLHSAGKTKHDVGHIVEAFVVGSVSNNEEIQSECANALSFIIT